MVDHKHIVVSKRLVAINSASSVVAKVVNFFVLMWVYQHLLKRLPTEEFAVLPLVSALLVFAPLFFTFFSGGISRYILDAYAKGDFEELRRIISSLFPFLVGVAAAFVSLGFLFAANIEHVFNIVPRMVGDARLMMSLLVVSFAFQMVTLPFKTAYMVRQRYVEQSLLEVARDFLRAILVVGFLLLIGTSVIWVVVATFISEALLSVTMLLRSFRLVPELRFSLRFFDFAKARELMNFGLWIAVGRLGVMMYTNAATLLLNLYGTAVDVASYHVGATFFRQLESTINLAAMPLQPAVTAMNALEDRRRLASTVLRGGRYAVWLAMLVATPMMIYADLFIGLYLGDRYSTAAMVIVLFMIILPFNQPTVLLPITAIAMARVRDFFLPSFLFLLGGLLLMFVSLIYFDFGAVGVTACLTLITVASQLTYFWGLCLKLTGVDFGRFCCETLLRGLVPAVGGAVVWTTLRYISPPENWTILMLNSAAGSLVYLIVLVAFCLTPAERADLAGLRARLSGMLSST